MLRQQFVSLAQQSIFEKIGGWMRELFGELIVVGADEPSISLTYGSATVFVTVSPWTAKDAVVCVRSWVATGVSVAPELMFFLLTKNGEFPYGAFGLDAGGDVFLDHALVGSTCDKEELRASVLSVMHKADEYDDVIVARWGGTRAIDR